MKLLLNVRKERMSPTTEGVNHINIYSRSRLELGRFLSHFASHPTRTEEHGVFLSMEGYYYWLLFGDDTFREITGPLAKDLGKHHHQRNSPVLLAPDSPEFQNYILKATTIKLDTMDKELREQLLGSRLPLIHAYLYQGKYTFQSSMDYIIAHINKYRIQH